VPDNDDKRRLPVLQPKAEAEEPARPPWHWVGFGAVAIFVVWLPLAYVAEAVSRRLTAGALEHAETLSRHDRLVLLARIAAPQALALVLASVAGGFLVTRFGKGTRGRDAAFAGLAVGLLALGLTFAQAGPSVAPIVVPLLAAASAAAGGALGKRKGAGHAGSP
jgi:hypothetical protein